MGHRAPDLDGHHGPPLDLAHLAEAGQRLVRSVDGLHRRRLGRRRRCCPGWSRAHVVAHLALNGEALGGRARGARPSTRRSPMYESQEARDDDIEELAGADHAELRERLLRRHGDVPGGGAGAAGRRVGGPVRAHPRRADAAAAAPCR